MPAAKQTINPDFPPLTAAQLAAVLGKTPNAVKKQLRYVPASGCRIVSGNEAAEWHAAALPNDLRSDLCAIAHAKGFNSVGEMIRAGEKAWQPAVALADTDPVWSEARKLREALRPSLQRGPQFVLSQASFERDGVADFEKVFGHKISTRHFRKLIVRTRNRDGGRENWEALTIYLPDRLKRQPAAPAPAPDFPLIAQAIASPEKLSVPRGERPVEISRAEYVWEVSFETYDQHVVSGRAPKLVARQLRDYLAERMPSLATNRDDLLKKFDRRLSKWLCGEKLDKRKGKGEGPGNSNGWKKDTGAPIAESELTKQIKELPWFIPAARFFYMRSNRNHEAGSVPEALRWVIQLPNLPTGWPEHLRRQFIKAICANLPQPITTVPTCPEKLRDEILARRNSYRRLVPAKIEKQIIVNSSTVQYFRSPREWALQNQSAPGSQRRHTNRDGERVIMQPGDWFGGDDATPGIAVCVAANGIQTPSSQKFGVMLGRFQWLAFHDARTDKLLAYDYVVRPRGSYRAEDILNGMSAVVKTHGIPRHGFQFEGGVFAAKLVKQTISNLKCKHWQTYSPHQKSIEAIFNKVWTRLGVQFPHADMGRYRNENESNCKLYEACKAGHKDPRQFFPTLADVVKVFDEEVGYHNGKPIDSKQYGRWVPDDFFASAVHASPLREHSAAMDWMFSPWAVERTVSGMMVKCRVPMFEGFSVPFEFGADWLPQYHGKKVRLHFNPRQPNCVAKVVSLDTGEVLGDAPLIGETAQHIRFIMEWGDDNQRAGFIAKQKAAHFVRRETRGVGAGGRVEYSKSEERDGLTQIGIVERGPTAPAPVEDEQARRQSRLAMNLETSAEQSTNREQRRLELEDLENQTAHLFT